MFHSRSNTQPQLSGLTIVPEWVGRLLLSALLFFSVSACDTGDAPFSFVSGQGSITITPADVTLPVSGKQAFRWTSNISDVASVSWDSSDKNIDANGIYTAPSVITLPPGASEITVRIHAQGNYAGGSPITSVAAYATVHVKDKGQASVTVK